MATRIWAATISTIFSCRLPWKMSVGVGRQFSIAEGVQRLRRAVIRAKEELSFVPDATIELDLSRQTLSRARSSRELLERLIAPIVERTLEPCRACLADAKLTPSKLTK